MRLPHSLVAAHGTNDHRRTRRRKAPTRPSRTPARPPASSTPNSVHSAAHDEPRCHAVAVWVTAPARNGQRVIQHASRREEQQPRHVSVSISENQHGACPEYLFSGVEPGQRSHHRRNVARLVTSTLRFTGDVFGRPSCDPPSPDPNGSGNTPHHRDVVRRASLPLDRHRRSRRPPRRSLTATFAPVATEQLCRPPLPLWTVVTCRGKSVVPNCARMRAAGCVSVRRAADAVIAQRRRPDRTAIAVMLAAVLHRHIGACCCNGSERIGARLPPP